MAETFDEIAAALTEAGARVDRRAAWEITGHLITHLSDLRNPVPASLRQLTWTAAINNRWFDIAEALVSAAARRADATPALRRLQAQMLMERGFTEEALARIYRLLGEPGLADNERGEAMGHIGRIHKDRLIEAARQGDTEGARQNLQRSLDGYLKWYEAHPESVWHGINAAALLSRPEAASLDPGAAAKALRIAESVVSHLSAVDQYREATLAEAAVARDDSAAALAHIRNYLADARTKAFMLANLVRQFRQVWQLDRRPAPWPDLLDLISAELLTREGGVVRVSAEDCRRAASATDKRYEAVFGKDQFTSLENYRRGLERCACVARIGRTAERGDGTGFVIPGRLLHARFGETPLLLTNAHVISEDQKELDGGALHPEEALVTFAALEGVDPGKEYAVGKIHFASPREDLDVFIAELSETPPLRAPYLVAPRLPVAGKQVRVIGHPGGGGLSLSVNELLDHQAPKIHYRTATEGGSSGSPVFNEEWRLIGIHHAGGEAVPKLNNNPGTYQANEGIWIQEIAKALEP